MRNKLIKLNNIVKDLEQLKISNEDIDIKNEKLDLLFKRVSLL